MSLMVSGVGNLIGYLGSGWWLVACGSPTGTRWPVFWGGLVVVVAAVTVYFLTAYHGKGAGLTRRVELEAKAVSSLEN